MYIYFVIILLKTSLKLMMFLKMVGILLDIIKKGFDCVK